MVEGWRDGWVGLRRWRDGWVGQGWVGEAEEVEVLLRDGWVGLRRWRDGWVRLRRWRD